MPQTALTPVQLKQDNYAVQAGDLTITPAAADAVNGNSFVATGSEILLIQNTDASPHNITITSVADSIGRTDSSLTNYSCPANSISMIQISQLAGWIQAGQVINLLAASALLHISVLRKN